MHDTVPTYGILLLTGAVLVATYHFVHTSYTPLRLLAIWLLYGEAAIRQAAKTVDFAARHYWHGYPAEVRAVREGVAEGSSPDKKVRAIR